VPQKDIQATATEDCHQEWRARL